MKVNLDYVEKESLQKLQLETEKCHIVHPKLDYQTVINGYLVPGKTERSMFLGGVMDSKDSYVAYSGWREGSDCTGYCVASDNIVRRTGTALYIGYFHYVWGHVITDNLKKVWAICNEGILEALIVWFMLRWIIDHCLDMLRNYSLLLELILIRQNI